MNAKARGNREHDRGHSRSPWLKAARQVDGWGEVRLQSQARPDSAPRATGANDKQQSDVHFTTPPLAAMWS